MIKFGENKKIAIISGSSLFSSDLFKDSTEKEEKLGEIVILYKEKVINSKKLIIIQRHHATKGEDYYPPHLIDHRSIWKFLKQKEISIVFGFCSVGTLKPKDISHEVGKLILPEDFFSPWDIISTFDDARSHCVPELNQELISFMHKILVENKIDCSIGGIYGQTKGPRFETKSEITFLSQFSTVVGMTGAHEATLAKELDIKYAMLCIIDNYANGLEPKNSQKLSLEHFKLLQQKNKAKVEASVKAIIENIFN